MDTLLSVIVVIVAVPMRARIVFAVRVGVVVLVNGVLITLQLQPAASAITRY